MYSVVVKGCSSMQWRASGFIPVGGRTAVSDIEFLRDTVFGVVQLQP